MNQAISFWNALPATEQTAIAVVLMILIYAVTRTIILTRMERLAARTSNDLDDRLVQFAKQFLWVIALFLTIVLVLRINQVEIAPLLAGAGIFGVAIGFAAKETLSDILSGVFLIADRPVRVGDRVKIEHIGRHWGSWGDVVDIGLRRTRIRNTDGVIVNYPNSLLANSVISNFTFEKGPIRIRVRFQVSYQADLDKTKEIALEAIQSVPKVLSETAAVVVRSLWDDSRGHLMSGVLLEGRYKIEQVRERTAIRSIVLNKILTGLKEAGIPLASQPIHVTGDCRSSA